jgi:AmmeMemoRadiSam system protein A/AmmeMemoRadiSam system protein B
MVPEVGGDAVAEVRGSIAAMAELTQRIIQSGAETVVLISPHAPLDARAFVAYHTSQLHGDFANFRAPDAHVEFRLDQELLEAIAVAAAADGYEVLSLAGAELDHGAAVPLYFLDRNGWRGRAVVLGYSFLTNEDHLKFGACLTAAAEATRRSVALIASGDLSHRLKPRAPAGYNPAAYRFDEEVVAALHDNSPGRIVEIDPDLRRTAGECGYRSMLVALGATEKLPRACEVLHYEAPFGVGYLVAQLTNALATKRNAAQPVNEDNEPDQSVNGDAADADTTAPDELASDLPALARLAVETFVRTGKQISAPEKPSELLAARAGCFVSIKTRKTDDRSNELRGCIGTIEPTTENLAEEIIANAINAATRDPRFSPVAAEELPALRYSVDVLEAPEPATFAELDPKVYGVIVEDQSETFRGLLLPDIAGVDTAARQVEIAARKAGIAPDGSLKLSRFRVHRYREQ